MVEKRIMLEFIYKKPSVEEAKKISEASIDDKRNNKSKDNIEATKSYRNHCKTQAIQFFIGGLICAVIGIFSIFVMISGVDGPFSFLIGLSDTLLGVLSIIMPLAGLILFVIAIMFFVKSNLSPSASRPKSPEALFKMLFDDNIYFINTSGSASKIESNIAKRDSFGYTRLCKFVPEDLKITQEQFNEYCSSINKIVEQAEKTIENALKTDTMNVMKNGVSINVNSMKELYNNIYEVNAVFTKSYNCFYNKFKNNATAILEFNIKSILVKSGGYWYPYDLMPDLTIIS